MGQLITTIVCVLVLLIVPLGVVQVHTVMQMRSELLELSFSTAKFISNRGGTSSDEVLLATKAFIRDELSHKAYRLEEKDVQLELVRTKAHDSTLWSHEDVFQLKMEIPYPVLTTLFSEWQHPIAVKRTGSINTMDYDLR